MTFLALSVVVVHGFTALATLTMGPRTFLRYQVVVAGVYASGLLEVFEGTHLGLPGGELGVTGALWLVSGALMVVFTAMRWREIAGPTTFLVRHYGWVLLLTLVLHLLFGRLNAASVLNFLEFLYPFLTLVLCTAYVRTGEDRKGMVVSLFWFSATLVFLLPLNLLLFGESGTQGLVYSRVMSASMLPAFVMLLVFGARVHWKWLLPAFVLMLIPLWTVSRGVTLALSIALLLYAAGGAAWRKEYNRKAMRIFLLAGLAGGLLVSPRFVERTFGDALAGSPGETTVNTSGRLGLWSLFADHLLTAAPVTVLLGEGFGAGDRFAEERDPAGWFTQPHSEYVRFVFNFGLVGALAYYSMFLRFLRLRRRAPKRDPADRSFGEAAALLIVSLLVLSFYENFIFYNPYGFTQNAFIVLSLSAGQTWFPASISVSSDEYAGSRLSGDPASPAATGPRA